MPYLIAAAADWISFLIPLVVAIIWILNQVFGRLAQPQNPPRDLRRPPLPPPGQRPQQPARVDEEIEAFLRRASQQKGQAQQRQPVPQAAAKQPRTLAQRAEALPSSARRAAAAEAVVPVEVVEEPQPARSMSVAEHVQKHLDTRTFENRAAQLTKVDQVDKQMQEHLTQAFDHELSTLAARTQASEVAAAAAAAATASRVTAGGVFAMLKDPNSLRNAVIMQEILRRPEERF